MSACSLFCSCFRKGAEFAGLGLVAMILPIANGCGGGPQTPVYSASAVTISTQPASQSVPLGQAATFTVVASGSTPLLYQWSENGSAIPGATGASYTTPEVAVVDSGSSFAVTVSNSVNSVTSNTATLTVGPRSPKAGDLRFQEVGSSSEAEQSLEGTTSGIISSNDMNRAPQGCSNCVGSPLTIGNDGGCIQESTSSTECYWSIFTTPLPPGQTGLNTYYWPGVYADFALDLNSSLFPGVPPPDSATGVITSLDFQPAYGTYAMAWVQNTQQDGAFNLGREIVLPGAVESTVAADAAASRVVTAVSFDADGNANLLSYGWKGDTTTVFDTAVISATTQQEIETSAQTLANQGYIVTAFGGDATDGFLLIGTKVQGDTLARPLIIADQSSAGCDRCTVGYAPVIWYEAPAKNYSVIYEK